MWVCLVNKLRMKFTFRTSAVLVTNKRESVDVILKSLTNCRIYIPSGLRKKLNARQLFCTSLWQWIYCNVYYYWIYYTEKQRIHRWYILFLYVIIKYLTWLSCFIFILLLISNESLKLFCLQHRARFVKKVLFTLTLIFSTQFGKGAVYV